MESPSGGSFSSVGLGSSYHRIIKWQVEWGSWKSCSATHFSLSGHPHSMDECGSNLPTNLWPGVLGWSTQSRRTMWPSTPLQLPLPSVPSVSGWHDGPACFPNPFSPDRGGGPQGLLVTGFPWHRLSLRHSSLCDSLPSLHSAFLSGDVMTSDLSGKRGRKMLTSSFFYCGHSEKSSKVLTASPLGSKPQKAL